MKEKTKKKFIVALIMLLAIAVLPVGQAQASLQSNPNTQYKSSDQKKATDWIKQIREMETGQGSMGLNETLNGNLTASSESNNIDVHMMRSTEYGAIAILSASGYGNPQTLQNSSTKTTTGNKTGVYFSGTNYEFVAGGLSGSAYNGVDKRYYDAYGTNNSSSYDYDTNKSNAKVGDALGDGTTANKGCFKWHSASYASWVYSSLPYFIRGNGGLFSFNFSSATLTYWGRGVAVVGAGL